jgi:serine/threonine-protein phosphatase 6 regulatory subunit 2
MFGYSEMIDSNVMTVLDVERLKKGVQKVHAAIIPRLEDFHSILLNPPSKPSIQTTFGTISQPFGITRLEVVHLIQALLSSNNPQINRKIEELKILPVLIVS